MAYKLATAYVDIEARVTKLEQQLKQSRNNMNSWLSGLAGLGSSLGITLGIGAAIAAGRQFIAQAVESHDAESRLRAVINATGGAAGKTAEEILAMATAMQAVTGTSDEMITDAASKMLTFKTVTGDTFDRAMKAAMDLSATGFGSIQGASVQLGKALEDPIRGLGALRKAGVSFTEEQKKQIKQFVETNQLLKAQDMILAAVEGQVGGVAEAMGKTPAGQWKILLATISDIGEELGKRILPVVVQWGKIIAPIISGVLGIVDALGAVNDATGGMLFWWTSIPKWIERAQQFLAPIIPLLQQVGEQLRYAFQRGLEVIKTVGAAVWEWIGAAVEALANAFGTTTKQFGDDFLSVIAGIAGFIGELAMDTAEWMLIIAQHFDKVVDVIWNGLKFVGGTIYDTLVGGFTAAFNTFIDVATRVFASIPRLMEAGFQGGLAGIAGQLADEVAGAITDAQKNFAAIGESDFTKQAREDMMATAKTLTTLKRDLERDRPGMNMPKPAEAKKIAAPAVAEVIHKIEMPTGLMGITDAWKNLQEAMLKSDSPEERTAESLERGEDLWQKQVDAQLETNSKLDKMIALDGVI